MSQPKQHAICVLGMHRSGTSAIARALNLLGAYIGPAEKMMPPEKENNPEGFWEHLDIVDFHDRLLRNFGLFWDSVIPLPDQWWKRPEVDPYRQELEALIQREFAGHRLWLWKDPRTALVLPLWIEVLQRLNIEISFVICLRHPLDVAASLQRRDGLSQTRAFALWQLYTVSAVHWVRNSRCHVVSYDQLLDNWELRLTQLALELAVDWPSSIEKEHESLRIFLRRDLRHSRSQLTDLSATGAIGEILANTYTRLLKAETSPSTLQSDDFTNFMTQAYTEYHVYAALLGGDVEHGVQPRSKQPVLEVFWQAEGSFTPAYSTAVEVQVDGKEHVYECQIPLPLKGELRLDPVNLPAYAEVSAITLSTTDPASSTNMLLHSWGKEEGFPDVIAGRDVILLSGQGKKLRLIAAGPDPQLYLRGIPTEESQDGATQAVFRVAMRIETRITNRCTETLNQWYEFQQKEAEDKLQAVRESNSNQVCNLEQTLQEQTATIAELQQTTAELKTQYQQQQREVELLHEQQQREVELLHEQQTTLLRQYQEESRLRTLMLHSLSWRITAPLRTLRVWLRSLWRIFRWPRLHHMILQPQSGVAIEGNGFVSTSISPQLLLQSSCEKMPTAWVLISYVTQASERWLRPHLYIDSGAGFSEREKVTLHRPIKVRTVSSTDTQLRKDREPSQGHSTTVSVQFLLCLPQHVHGLMLNPLMSPGRFVLTDVMFREINTLQVFVTILQYHLGPLLFQPTRILQLAAGTLKAARVEGLSVVRRRLLLQKSSDSSDYAQWIALYDTISERDRILIRHHVDRLSVTPLISVIMPTYNTPEEWLVQAIESVRGQLYPYWELCIADDASTQPQVKRILKHYQAKDPRIKVVYREQNGHIAAATNSALALATGEFVAFLDHDDRVVEHALYMVAVELNAHPDADLLYSDEDKIDEEEKRYHPYMKPDWNPDLFLSQNLVTHLCVCRKRLVELIGGLREGYEGAQDWDLVMRLSEQIPPTHIRHIPHVLYHWRAISGSTALASGEKSYIQKAQWNTLRSHFERLGQQVEIVPTSEVYWRIRYPLPNPPPLVTLIIPTRDGVELLHRCIESIRRKTTYANYEILIIDNQSSDQKTLEYLQSVSCERQVRVLRYDAPFNFSAINNCAVKQARGEVIGFINNDIEVITTEWLEEMVAHALRSEIGAVGAMLYYPNETIQHAGVILGLGGIAGHIYTQSARGHHGRGSRALLTQNLSAVTAACLVLRRAVFEEVGGFDAESFPVAFNDVDLCLRIRERGYRNLWTPHAELYHWESASRGYEDTPEKQRRFKREISNMQQRWGDLLFVDPAYNINLTLEQLDSSLAFPPRVKKPWEQY